MPRDSQWMPRTKKKRLSKKEAQKRFKVLQANHSGFTGEAIWRKLRLVAVSPTIDFILTMQPKEAEIELKSRGWTCKWIC